MCGILGTINTNTIPFDIYSRYMLHRGPDSQQHKKINNIDLYHYRLAIQDLSNEANQPMQFNDYHIIFNGEIYNHLELRRKYDLQCSTSSDTETILKLYNLIGSDMLCEFDGMFAIAIYNSKNKNLFLARDRAGKKPLYYYKKNEQFVFASEQNAINKIITPELNNNIINNYFFLGCQFQKDTVYKNTYEVGNGSYLNINTVSLEIEEKKWWDIYDVYSVKKEKLSLNDAKQKFTSLFDLAVKRRLESSDLEVGAFLSGGIDSGLVTAFATKYTQKLKTFTVAFEGTYNEAPLARKVAEKYKTQHTEININFSNLEKDFEQIISNYGEPYMDGSAIPSYYVAKEAKKYVTVILNGDGADEFFGGYRRYVPFSKYDFFTTPNLIKITAKKLLDFIPIAHNKKSIYNYLYRLISFISKNGIDMYLSATSDIFTGFEEHFYTKPELLKISEEFIKINESINSGLDKIMCMDFITLLFGDLLVKMDVATMAHSLEGRSPFLSKELMEFAPSLNNDLKIKGRSTKYLLRQVAKDILPREIFNQPKRGFEIPMKSWIDNELNPMLNDCLSKQNALYLDFVDREFIQRLMLKKVNVSDEKRAKMLYNILCLETWHNSKNK